MWDVFAPHYIELVKGRAYGDGVSREEAEAARWTLHHVLRSVLRLAAPIIPHITDYIWRSIYGGTVHRELFPEVRDEWNTQYAELGRKLMEFNSSIWKTKKERGMRMKDPIEVDIPEELMPFEGDLRRLHNIR